jgi:hypothetical protein
MESGQPVSGDFDNQTHDRFRCMVEVVESFYSFSDDEVVTDQRWCGSDHSRVDLPRC